MKPRVLTAEEHYDRVAYIRGEGSDYDDVMRMIRRVRDEAITWAVHVALETGGKDAWRAADAIRLRAAEVHR